MTIISSASLLHAFVSIRFDHLNQTVERKCDDAALSSVIFKCGVNCL